jgi:hypothetical protein
MCISMRLSAHFGQWLQVDRQGRKARQWQVAAGLIYGQVKKSYRRRKLVRVTPLMRLGTQADLTVALQALGFSGRLNTAFIERVQRAEPTDDGQRENSSVIPCRRSHAQPVESP